MSVAFRIKKCCNKTVFIILSVFIIKKCCNNAFIILFLNYLFNLRFITGVSKVVHVM